MTKAIEPSLFGIKYLNRDFTKKDSWSKNNFNWAFPASLIAYTDSKNIPCVYLKLNEKGEVIKDYISARELYYLKPLDNNLYYSFESSYTPYQPLSIGSAPGVDWMLMNLAP